jgi:hypothetical protein
LPSDPFVVEEKEGFLKPQFYLLECILDQQSYVRKRQKGSKRGQVNFSCFL